MLDIQGIICHGKVIHDLIKSIMGDQLDYLGINILVEHISGGMCIISTEDYFGNMFLQLGLSISKGSYIDTTSNSTKGGEVLFLGCSFINQRSNCFRFCKGIGNLDSLAKF